MTEPHESSEWERIAADLQDRVDVAVAERDQLRERAENAEKKVAKLNLGLGQIAALDGNPAAYLAKGFLR